MTKFLRKTILATALTATALTAVTATPAMAHGRGGGGDAVAAGIFGGIVGLVIGAAVSSGNNHRREQVAYNDGYAPAYGYQVSPEWEWREGWYWDHYGNRYYRDGRPSERNGYERRGYNDGRGYEGRGYEGRSYEGRGDYRGGYADQRGDYRGAEQNRHGW